MIITFTGESGSGKSTIARSLVNSGNFYFLTSTTTRAARDTDLLDEYEHISQEEFEWLKHNDAFIWTASYSGNNYGTKYTYIDEAIDDETNDHILILVPQVLPILLDYAIDVIPFFVKTPKRSILKKRMKERGDSAESIEKRLKDFGKWENEAKKSNIPYRFITNEGTVEEAVNKVLEYLK